jgi:hypothetical protein
MSSLELVPFAACLEWSFEEDREVHEWINLFEEYFVTLAKKSALVGNTVIGHIKGFTKLEEYDFIQISAISATQPVITTMKNECSGRYKSISITLNLLVYGLPFSAAERIVHQSAIDLMDESGGHATLKMVSSPDQPGH